MTQNNSSWYKIDNDLAEFLDENPSSTELRDFFRQMFEKGKKVGRDELLSQIKGLATDEDEDMDLTTICKIINKLR